jgi:hypothetical protein
MQGSCYSCKTLKKLELSRQIIEKDFHLSLSTKILPFGAELFHVVRRTDRQARRSKYLFFVILLSRLQITYLYLPCVQQLVITIRAVFC